MDQQRPASPGCDRAARNEFSGEVGGPVVQARDVHGDLHLHARDTGGRLPVPAQLAPLTPWFTDREELLRRLDDLVWSTSARLIVLCGLGGTGKTTLALAWLHRHRDQWPDGQLSGDLGERGDRRPPQARLLAAWLRALGVPSRDVPAELAELAALWRTLTASRRLGVLLDGVASAQQLHALLPSGPGSVVVATSRTGSPALIATGARLLPVGPLPHPAASCRGWFGVWCDRPSCQAARVTTSGAAGVEVELTNWKENGPVGFGEVLWPHQREAIDLIVKQLVDGGRCQAILACGTGKTRIGIQAAQRLAPAGRVLVVVPSVLLLAQTLRAYRAELGDPGLGRVLAVCSDVQVGEGGRAGRDELATQHVEVTTAPGRIAEVMAGPGRVTVISTYASLAALVRAHRRQGAPAWDLVIADEAHRSAGGGPWSRLHHDGALPARRRLYMTATPRILGAGQGADAAVGMDDETVYGPVSYRLGLPAAIELGFLASWRLVVSVITSEEVRKLAAADDEDALLQIGGAAIPARMLASQIALLRAAKQYDLRAAITYHSGVASARAFAATLPAAAQLLPEAERPVLRWAGDIHGAHTAAQRELRLRHLTEDKPGLAVVANARLLGEGIDLPDVDAVAFCDPRRSVVDIVQALGRALRLGGRSGKVATIVVPLLAGDDADEQPLAGEEHAALRRVIQALRAHDDDLAAELDHRARARYQHLEAGATGQEGPGLWRPRWLEVTGRKLPAGFADAVTVRLVEAATSSWERGYAAVAAYQAQHGHLRITNDYQCGDGFRPGIWLQNQRFRRRNGRLPADLAGLLDALGVDWNPGAWQRFLQHATAHAAQHGHLNVPLSHIAPSGYPLGKALHRKRRERRQGSLPQEHIAALDALGMVWDAFQDTWDDWYALAAAYHQAHGDLLIPVQYRTPAGQELGHWISQQRQLHNKNRLSTQRQRRLTEIGMVFAARDWQWQRYHQAVNDFHDHHGHLRIPSRYRTADGLSLYGWLYRQRRDFHKLTAERQALLSKLDPALGTPAADASAPPAAAAAAHL